MLNIQEAQTLNSFFLVGVVLWCMSRVGPNSMALASQSVFDVTKAMHYQPRTPPLSLNQSTLTCLRIPKNTSGKCTPVKSNSLSDHDRYQAVRELAYLERYDAATIEPPRVV